MGGLVIETIRPGVQFTPAAAAAFRRAEVQVRAEFGRDIDANSTYRSRSKQLAMYNAWQAYVSGRGPYPGHSKALHPDDPLAFHIKGEALDSDDWRIARVVQILAENGFIRNRLHVPNEQHHFEYIRARDKNYGKPAGAGGDEDEMSEKAERQIDQLYKAMFFGGPSMSDGGKAIQASLAKIASDVKPIRRDGKDIPVRQEIADIKTVVLSQNAAILGMESALKLLATSKGLDPAAILKAAQEGVEKGLRNVTFTADIDG